MPRDQPRPADTSLSELLVLSAPCGNPNRIDAQSCVTLWPRLHRQTTAGRRRIAATSLPVSTCHRSSGRASGLLVIGVDTSGFMTLVFFQNLGASPCLSAPEVARFPKHLTASKLPPCAVTDVEYVNLLFFL